MQWKIIYGLIGLFALFCVWSIGFHLYYLPACKKIGGTMLNYECVKIEVMK
mgnify:CR=1 FL=1